MIVSEGDTDLKFDRIWNSIESNLAKQTTSRIRLKIKDA